MNNDNQNQDEALELLKKIDNIEFVPKEELDKMDFYELAYYMQVLNQLTDIKSNEGEQQWN